MKYAVYVEGLSEMLFVADVLQKYSNFDSNICGFQCITLNADRYIRESYPSQGNESSSNYYQIVNVNNDNRVISKLKADISNLLHSGFDVIIGLKDVYGTAYDQLTTQRVVDNNLIAQLHSTQFKAINSNGGDLRLHFAIMEYEAWMLALIDNFVTKNGKSFSDVCTQLNIDLSQDIESSIYHPYPIVRKFFQACGKDYHKHEDNSYSFLSTIDKAAYETLRLSGHCASFKKFIDSLLCGACPQLP